MTNAHDTEVLSRDELNAVLHAAIRAPSADNHHRVLFHVGKDRLALQATNGAIEPALPHRRTLSLVSLGAMTESACLRARAFGVAGDARWFPDPSHPDFVCEIRWSRSSEVAPDPLAEAIDSRHTNRAFYHGPRLAPPALARLEQAAGQVPGARVLWLDDAGIRRRVLRLIRLAETERFRSEVLHAELFSAIRFDVGWEATCEEGLPPGALGVERLMRAPFASLRHWPLSRMLNRVGVHKLLGVRAAYVPCRLSPHLVVLASDQELDQAAVAAGRALQRFWLAATSQGLAVQPLAAATVLPLQTSDEQGTREEIRRLLREGWDSICPALRPLIVLRVGHARAPAVRTARHPVEHYMAQRQGAIST